MKKKLEEGLRPGNDWQSELLPQILQALEGLRFGSLELVVHEGRVVQLDRRERFRLDRKPQSQD